MSSNPTDFPHVGSVGREKAKPHPAARAGSAGSATLLPPYAQTLVRLFAAALLCAATAVAAQGQPWPPAGKTDRLAEDLTARNFYVVLDGSGSMAERACQGSGRKMDQAKDALAVFSKSVPANANLGLAVFDNRGIKERVALGTENRKEFLREVGVTAPSGGTPLRDAIALARTRIEDQARRQLGYGEYTLVVVTDGEASAGQDPRAVVNEILARSPIIIHTIGFCISDKHSLNQPGRTVYKAANDRADLERGLEAALAEAPNFTADRFSRPR